MRMGISKKSRSKKRESFIFIMFVIPAVIVFSAVVFYPLISSIRYSFTDFSMRNAEYNFVGWKNFQDMFQDKLVMAGMKNTFVFALYTATIGNILALLLAVALDSKLRLKNYFRIVFYLPCLLSPIVVSAIFSDILQYNGLLNQLMTNLGLPSLVNDWFSNEATAMPMLIGLNAWQWAGYGSVIYLAGLQVIPADLYEAAKVDGANRIVTFFKITLPLLMPSITIMTFMSITGGLKLFDIPYVMTNGGPGMSTETLGTVIYTTAFRHDRFGYATAISVVFFLVIASISIFQVQATRKKEVQL